MTKYLFTGETPAIFADLSFGPDVVASHSDPTWPDHDPEGSTVTLYPGDTLELAHEYPEHAYLQPLDAKATKLTLADIKAELTAREIEHDPKGKKADLEALLAEHLPTITSEGIVPAAAPAASTEE
jgi:hypothetical protein